MATGYKIVDVVIPGGTGGGGGEGTSNYNELSNKPKINNVTLSGNKTAAGLGLATKTELTELSVMEESNAADINSMRNNMNELGDVHVKSVDMDELPKVCHYDMIIISSGSPSITPDFIGQVYIDKDAGKVYMATATTNSSSFKALN